MPKKSIEPHPVKVRNKSMWRVIIPGQLAGGKPKQRFFRAREKAAAFAAEVESTRSDHRNGFDMLTAQDRAIVGRAIQRAGGVQIIEQAVEFFLTHNPRESRTVPELVHEFLADRKRIGLSPSYLRSLEVRLRGFALAFDRRDVQRIRPEEISRWLHAQGWSPTTMQGCLKDARTLFSYAVKRRYGALNPAEAVERPKASRKAPGILSVADAERFMRAVERWDAGLIPYVSLILFGGLRPEESARCRVDFLRGDVIDLPAGKTKNNKRRLIELRDLPTLRAWLARGGDMPPVNLRKRMDAVRRATAVKDEMFRVPPIQWCSDILRHSFVSYAVPIHGVAQTGLLADHSEAVLKKHYRELVTRADAEAFWRILPTTADNRT